MKILMVCLGNICRSPLAEGIMQSKIEEMGLDWTIESAGTGSWHIGEPPDGRSVETAHRHGINITGQRARQFHSDDLDEYDLIIAMDGSNYQDIHRMANLHENSPKVKMILDYSNPGQNLEVPDPYWDNNGFEKVFHLLDEACETIIGQLINDLSIKSKT